MEAGFPIRHALLDKSGQVVGSKAVSPEAIMRDIRSWGETQGLSGKTDAELLGAYVKACEDFGLDLTTRLRAAKESAAAQEHVVGVPKDDAARGAMPPPDAPAQTPNAPHINADPVVRAQLALDQLAADLSPAGREWLAKQRKTRSAEELHRALEREGADREALVKFIDNQSARDYATSAAPGSRGVREATLKAVADLTANEPITNIEHLINELQNNAAPGSANAKVLTYIEAVWKGVQSPDHIAAVVAEVHAEAARSKISVTEALVKLSRESGATVVDIPPNPPGEGHFLPNKEFVEKYATQGRRFLDLNADNAHGATVHLIQELAVDRALREAGFRTMRSEQFRELLGGVVGKPGPSSSLAQRLWVEIYDAESSTQINGPEALHKRLKTVLPGLI